MSTAISMGVVALGVGLIAAGDPTIGGVDTMTAGLFLVIIGAIGAVLSLVIAATGSSARDGRADRRPLGKG